MKPGSVIVDLAAETGGNVETTVPGEVRTIHDVVHIGLTDLPSRLPTQSSTLYANNISKFLLSIGEKDHFHINLEDEVVRGSIVLKNGEFLWPPPMMSVSKVTTAAAAQEKKSTEIKSLPAPNPFNETLKSSLMYTGGMGSIIALGCASPNPAFTTMVTTFGLAGIVGYHTVWGVTPALHSPLMSVSREHKKEPNDCVNQNEFGTEYITTGDKCNFWNHCRWRHSFDGRSVGADKFD